MRYWLHGLTHRHRELTRGDAVASLCAWRLWPFRHGYYRPAPDMLWEGPAPLAELAERMGLKLP